jgi:tetratricopeptide (TPR) repeat protein
MKFKTMLPVAMLALAVGCNSAPKKTQKQEVTEQWNRTRAKVMYGLARDQYSTGNFDTSRQTTAEALRLDPENETLHLLSARLAIEGGQLEVASRELEQARKLNPKDAEADYLSGVVAQRWQKTPEALEFYAAAVQKNSDELAYLLAQSEMLIALERQEEALHLLQDKVVYFENSAVIRDAVGQLLVESRKYKEAADILRQASVLDSGDMTIREHLAFALYFAHNYRDAIEPFQQVLKTVPSGKRGDLWVALGQSQLESGLTRDARRSFETASQIDPQSPSVNLAQARVAMAQNDYARAEIALKRALSLDPARSETRLLMGYLRLKQGKVQDALSSFQRASALDSSDTVSLCMVGYSLQQLGRHDEAIRYYAQALKIKPGDEMAARMMASLDSRD